VHARGKVILSGKRYLVYTSRPVRCAHASSIAHQNDITNLTIHSTHATMKTSLATLFSFATFTSAARLLLQIPNTVLVNPSTLPSTTHATLQSSGPPLDAYLTRSNTFNFNNVSAGSYLATVHCRDYAFEPLRIDVTEEEAVEGTGEKKEMIRAWQTFLGNEWDNKGESRGEGGSGLVVEARPVATKYFYQERQGCKLASDDAPWGCIANTSQSHRCRS
jgi:hypothetical protein